MAHKSSDLVQKKHNYAIVDEVDSVLIYGVLASSINTESTSSTIA